MKTNVWTYPSRIFHWYLAIGIVAAYLLSEYTQQHAAIGISLAVLVLFRIGWGIAGPRYSRFRDFPISASKIKRFIKSSKKEEPLYTGHNPLAALVMLLILATTILIVITGLATLLSEESFLSATPLLNSYELAHELHEIAVNVLIALVVLHLGGLAKSWHNDRKAQVVTSMITGIKRMPGINANLNLSQRAYAFLAGMLTIATLLYLMML